MSSLAILYCLISLIGGIILGTALFTRALGPVERFALGMAGTLIVAGSVFATAVTT